MGCYLVTEFYSSGITMPIFFFLATMTASTTTDVHNICSEVVSVYYKMGQNWLMNYVELHMSHSEQLHTVSLCSKLTGRQIHWLHSLLDMKYFLKNSQRKFLNRIDTTFVTVIMIYHIPWPNIIPNQLHEVVMCLVKSKLEEFRAFSLHLRTSNSN